ncbi:hypothetical protein EKD04_017565 [Chloroflexales bacterium ZM16-3]|nr:hypothetical protein [Chloroflexales bacterium ZM16-3]
MTATSSTPAVLAGVLLFALPDSEGVTRRIALHPPGHYAVDDRWPRLSLMVGQPDGSVELSAPTADAPRAKVSFPHLGHWDPRYLGYENLWMLITHYPYERTRDGQRHRLMHPELAGQSRWLTVQRDRGDGLIEPITCVAPAPVLAQELLGSWMRDRAASTWSGGDEDPSLGRSTLQVERILGVTITLRRVKVLPDDPMARVSPTWWTVVRSWPRPMQEPLVTTRWFSPGSTDWAITAFVGMVAGTGPHWR